MKAKTTAPGTWGGLALIGLTTAIGRGHPFYLDLVIRLLRWRLAAGQLKVFTVFEASHGLARLGWKTMAGLYRWSARSNCTISIYNALRAGQRESGLSSLTLHILGWNLRQALAGFPGICLVEHQLTARLLAPVCRVWYVHGDVAAPAECACSGPEKIFVPLEVTARGLIRNGCSASRIVRTGLMIEPELAAGAPAAFRARLERYAQGRPLRVAFFTSGAAPGPHINLIRHGIRSVIQQGLQAFFFCGTHRQHYLNSKEVAPRFSPLVIPDETTADAPKTVPSGPLLWLVWRPTDVEANQREVELLPTIDVFVAPTHERVNWALGLGLPLFALFPMIGTHAAMNYDLCLSQNVVYPLRTTDDARDLGPTLLRLQQAGALAEMARCGFGHFSLDGPQRIAEQVLAALGAGLNCQAQGCS